MKTNQLELIYKLVQEGRITMQEFLILMEPSTPKSEHVYSYSAYPTFTVTNTGGVNECYD
jgi:hypothetical protein